jgi:hypothetical protein
MKNVTSFVCASSVFLAICWSFQSMPAESARIAVELDDTTLASIMGSQSESGGGGGGGKKCFTNLPCSNARPSIRNDCDLAVNDCQNQSIISQNCNGGLNNSETCASGTGGTPCSSDAPGGTCGQYKHDECEVVNGKCKAVAKPDEECGTKCQ